MKARRMRVGGAVAAMTALAVAGCDAFSPPTADDRKVSIARVWNEVVLEGIRNDPARPNVHARSLWHSSAAMYDAWAAYDDTASTWLLGKTQAGYDCHFTPPPRPPDRQLAREEAVSFAAYRIVRQRFRNSPGAEIVAELADRTMAELGYDISETSSAYQDGSPAALGNYIAECYLAYGLQDGANEANGYAARAYEVVNPPIQAELPGNPNIVDLNRWQQIAVSLSIDESGNVVDRQRFVGPEWGAVDPFSLTEADKSTCRRAGFDYPVYDDPGPPPEHDGPRHDEYQWTHSLVAVWSGHLDPASRRGAELVDISPASMGNIESYPATFDERREFYELLAGGTANNVGYKVNPATGAPYEPQLVPRADYARAIAEFWAAGAQSETPPGHWFVIVNTIGEHPALIKRFAGFGPVLGSLEWDAKIYFALGGAMHDAAIVAWGAKGCYDYVRPVSAIRGMAQRGQSSAPDDPDCPYDVDGLAYLGDATDPAGDGSERVIDCVRPGDPLADNRYVLGVDAQNVGKIKVYAWRGPAYMRNPVFDVAGVGWILAEDWWPYMPPTLVTPPFPGYIAGHSIFSRTAAELITLFTGNPYFPGGKGELKVASNEFLTIEDGPSVDITLEWAKYVDAADQSSLASVWSGIHSPADDIPGRLIGMKLGPAAFEHARDYFDGSQ